MSALKLAIVAAAIAAPAVPAAAVTINFDNLTAGTVLSNQYASLGVTFTANPLSGANSNSSTQGWATNTAMTIASVTGTDVGTLGTPSLVSGNLLHGLSGWSVEDGDPAFRISFAAPISSISMTFASVDGSIAADTRFLAYNGSTLLATIAGTNSSTATNQFTLSYSAASITSVIVAPGSYDDWVGVDNIIFNPASAVPEPATWAMMIGGFGLAGGAMRRRATKVAFA